MRPVNSLLPPAITAGSLPLNKIENSKFQAPKFINPKFQNTNIKQIPMTEIQNIKHVWNLVLEIWDLYEFIFEKEDC
jgi:hypothetical protein